MSYVPVKERIWTIPCSEVWRWHCRWGISWTAQMVSLAQVSLALSSGLCKIKSMFRVGSNAWRHRKDYSIPAFIQSSVQGHPQQFHISQPQRHYVICILGRKGQRMPRRRLGAKVRIGTKFIEHDALRPAVQFWIVNEREHCWWWNHLLFRLNPSIPPASSSPFSCNSVSLSKNSFCLLLLLSLDPCFLLPTIDL